MRRFLKWLKPKERTYYVDEYGTIWDGMPGASNIIGDVDFSPPPDYGVLCHPPGEVGRIVLHEGRAR